MALRNFTLITHKSYLNVIYHVKGDNLISTAFTAIIKHHRCILRKNYMTSFSYLFLLDIITFNNIINNKINKQPFQNKNTKNYQKQNCKHCF